LSSEPFIIGTRGSDLALCQADMVIAALRAAHPERAFERKIITTTGDRRQDLRFSEFKAGEQLDKGIFVKELETALERGEIHAAVHSLKDVPSEMPAGFSIAAVLPRAKTEDVLVAREPHTIRSLPGGAKIGTSSVRRIRLLRWRRPDVQAAEIRGNVPTRLRKLFAPSELDGVILARAGLERLGLLRDDLVAIDDHRLSAQILANDDFYPAAGQGAIGIEARTDSGDTLALLGRINDSPTLARVQAEREFLRLLGAGCQTPVGALTRIEGTELHMHVVVFDEADENAPPFEAEANGRVNEPLALAAKLAAMVKQR
jgi:hydroxymethylbilane synthase